MIQSLDIKNNCFGIYYKNEFIFDKAKIATAMSECPNSWVHSPGTDDTGRSFSFILLRDRSISNYVSEPENYKSLCNTLEAQKKAALTAKISLTENCFFDIIPYKQLKKWFSHRQTAIENISVSLKKEDD